MVPTATKSRAKVASETTGLQVREVANALQLEKILEFRDRIMADERSINPDAMSRGEQLDQTARDQAARPPP